MQPDTKTNAREEEDISLGLRSDVEFARALAALILAAKLDHTRHRGEEAEERVLPPRWAT